jgi:hypothetical protein
MYTVAEANRLLRNLINERAPGFFYETAATGGGLEDKPLYQFLDSSHKKVYSLLLEMRRTMKLKDRTKIIQALRPMLNDVISVSLNVDSSDFSYNSDLLEMNAVRFKSTIGSKDEYYFAEEVSTDILFEKQSNIFKAPSFIKPLYSLSTTKIIYTPISTTDINKAVDYSYYKKITTISSSSTVFQLSPSVHDHILYIALGEALMMDKKENLGMSIINTEIKKLQGSMQ